MTSTRYKTWSKWPNAWKVVLSLAALTVFPSTSQASTSKILHHDTQPVESAAVLWKLAKDKFAKGHFGEAVRYYQQLVDKHAASKSFAQANLYLGITRLRLNEPKKAIAPLEYYIKVKQKSTETMRARLSLGRAYYLTKDFHKALLTSEEILSESFVKIPNEIHLEALLLKGWGLLGLNKDEHSQRVLAAFHDENDPKKSYPELNTHGIRLEVALKVRDCRKLPAKGKLDAGQFRSQLNRRGKCLLESLVLYQKAIKYGDPYWVEEMREEIGDAFWKYTLTCHAPPRPTGKSTAQETKSYREELKAILTKDCADTRFRALALLRSWKKQVPASSVYHLTELSKKL